MLNHVYGCTDQLDALKSDISILERFSDHISQFVSWWNVLELDNVSQHKRTAAIQTKYNAHREASVVANWMRLEDKYVDYTCAVCLAL